MEGDKEIDGVTKMEKDERWKKLYDKELLHDVFDRQMRIPNWDQKLVHDQVILCLGCGGLGTSVALACARLGCKKIYLIDFDIVESHNLNRQLLFQKDHVGKNKVDCSKEILERLHVTHEKTEFVTFHGCAKQNWSKIVKMSEDCTVIFDLIDQGGYWDVACQSLALARKVPLLSGGTFQTTLTVDFAPSYKPCYLCMSPQKDEKMVQKLLPSKILDYDSIDFIPKERYPVGASTVYVASTCANMMTAAWMQHLLGSTIPNRMIFYFETFDMVKWFLEEEKDCPLCKDFEENLLNKKT